MSAPLGTVARPGTAGAADLFAPFSLGALRLPNRIVMAPLTRARADQHGVPPPLAAEYYAQRAEAGLIIAEATAVSRQGTGYDNWPGLYTADQEAGWRTVTESVHAAGGRIFIQLFHAGRMSHPVFHQGALPVGPSPIPAGPPAERYDGVHPFTRPRALRAVELAGIAGQFRAAARRAAAAGFDGVEVHAGNGYLLDQFLRDGANHRTDAYGGSIANRARLPLEVTDAVTGVWGSQRVGYKLSPYFAGYSMSDSNPRETFAFIATELNKRDLLYLHVTEAIAGAAATPAGTVRATPIIRDRFDGTLIVNGGYDARSAQEAIAQGDADLVSFGVPFLANPDLPNRYRRGAALGAPDPATFYAGEEKGYIDYPDLT
jgi:N-ethylmaleimide reductase